PTTARLTLPCRETSAAVAPTRESAWRSNAPQARSEMPTRRHGPAYGLILPADLTAASRRRFLTGAAFMIGFAWAQDKAWAKGEEPSLRGITPGTQSTGTAFDG